MPKQQPSRTSFWEDTPTLEEIEAGGLAASPAAPASSGGWGSGSEYSTFGQSWVESLTGREQAGGGGAAGDRGTTTSDKGADPVLLSSALKNLEVINGIAAPQAFIDPGPKRIRNRAWEKEHQSEILRFSGMPVDLHEKVLGLSDQLGVTSGMTARQLLEYALDSYQQGQLAITPQVSQGRWTLFPTGSGNVAWTRIQGKGAKKTIKPRKRGKGGTNKKNGATMVGYREIPDEVQRTIRAIANQKDVPLSELGRFLIEFAISQYENGALEFQKS